MKTTQTSVGILDLRASGYGAIEIKKQMKTNTLSGFGLTTTTIALFCLLYWGLTSKEKIQSPPLVHHTIRTVVISDVLPPPETVVYDGIIADPTITKGFGLEDIAADPIPIPDDLISDDVPKFADISKIGRASSVGTPGGIDDGITIDGGVKIATSVSPVKIEEREEILPPEGEFQYVEKEPAIDLGKLQGFVKYPELARKVGVEGAVLIHALIGSDGSLMQVKVAESDNALLDAAAIQAVKDYGRFAPALQNGQAVACWVFIPIRFRLH